MSVAGSGLTLSADDLVLACQRTEVVHGAQIPAGPAVALIGAPCFVDVPARSGART